MDDTKDHFSGQILFTWQILDLYRAEQTNERCQSTMIIVNVLNYAKEYIHVDVLQRSNWMLSRSLGCAVRTDGRMCERHEVSREETAGIGALFWVGVQWPYAWAAGIGALFWVGVQWPYAFWQKKFCFRFFQNRLQFRCKLAVLHCFCRYCCKTAELGSAVC